MIPVLEHGWTRGRWAVVRVVVGLYLVLHFAGLVPYAAELFSSAGMLPDAGLSPLGHAPFNVLALCDAPWLVTSLAALGVGLGVAMVVGVGDRAAALGLWYLLACLVGRNPLIINPSLPYVGLVLLVHAMAGPGRRRSRDGDGWRLPGAVFAALWIAMAVGYGYSGITKLASVSWLDGTALTHVLNNPLARPGTLRELMLALPEGLRAAMTWGVLGLELAFAPLALSGRARPWLWAVMLAMHVGLVLMIDFADLSVGMIVLHVATFDPNWCVGLCARGSRRSVDPRGRRRRGRTHKMPV